MHKQPILIYFFIGAFLMKHVCGDATLELKMVTFSNPTEHLWDGSCCDTWCISSCDHKFLFSVDNAYGRQDGLEGSKVGSIFQKWSGFFQDQNENRFNTDISGVTNPIVLNFNSWPGGVLFKVYVEDDDSGVSNNDQLDAFIHPLYLNPEQSKTTAQWSIESTLYGLRPKDRTTLIIQYRLYCGDNYYGKNCSVYCLAQDSAATGHYTCNPSTGEPVCLPGWKTPATKCMSSINECENNDCRNGATCVSQIGSYKCNCAVGFAGTKCETPTNVQCKDGFHGTACEVNICDFISCLNEGNCTGGVCKCKAGYTGKYCEQGMTCKDRPCQHDGTCYDVGYRCDCLADYTGSQCEVTRPAVGNTTFEHYVGTGEDKEFNISSIFGSKAGGLLIALIVIAAVLLLLLIILIICLCRFRRRARNAEKECSMLSHGASTSSERTVTDNQYHSTRYTSQSSVFSDVSDGGDIPRGSRTTLIPPAYAPLAGNSEIQDPHYDTLGGGSLDAVAMEKKKAQQAEKEKGPPPPARPKVQKITDVRGESMAVERKASC